MLPLGVIKQAGSGEPRIAQLGITLQHPFVQIFAQAASQMSVTGPRSDIGAAYVERLVASSSSAIDADIQIEFAIPAHMGLGSAPMLGIGMDKVLMWCNQQPDHEAVDFSHSPAFEPLHHLEFLGAAQGGLLLVDIPSSSSDTSPPLWRAALQHDDKEAWAFVLVLLRVPEGTESTMELDRRRALIEATSVMTAESGELFSTVIQPAVERDDLVAFGQGLMALQELNHRALASVRKLPTLTEKAQAVLDLMKVQGAVAWGQSPEGYCCYALTKGARATINMRTALRTIVGHTDGHMIATITNNRGATLVEKAGRLPSPYDIRPA